MLETARDRPVVTGIASALAVGAAALGATDATQVTISGGPDATGQRYVWTVANHHDSPIVAVEIPHFRGGLFTVPTGWTGECSNLVGVGAADEPGLCEARAESPRSMIVKPRSATFELQLAAKGAEQGAGVVRVWFADGSETLVEDVIISVREPLADKLTPLIGLVVVGLLIVAAGGGRRRTASATG